jgi:hypothetical protein
VYFPEIKKNICHIFFGFEFISFPNRGLLSAATCSILWAAEAYSWGKNDRGMDFINRNPPMLKNYELILQNPSTFIPLHGTARK